jgi:ATP-dependent DNA ligase
VRSQVIVVATSWLNRFARFGEREEGVLVEAFIVKRRDSLYEPGKRSGALQKMRIDKTGESMIGGYTPAPRNVDALLVGYHERRKLIYVAKVRGVHTGIAGIGVQAILQSRNRAMPVQEFARVTPGPVGRRVDG